MAGTVSTRTAGSAWKPAEPLHPEWIHLNCLYICKGYADVDPGVQLLQCYCCKRKWHPSCALQSQDMTLDEIPEENEQWWCDSCDHSWNAGYAQGRKDAKPPVSVKTSQRPNSKNLVPAVAVAAVGIVKSCKNSVCEFIMPAKGKNPARMCAKRFKSSWDRDAHQASAHKVYTKDHPGHKCGICGNIFGYRHVLRDHMLSQHPPVDMVTDASAPAADSAPAGA